MPDAQRLSEQARDLRVLVDEATLQRRVGELGRQITADYLGRDLVLVGILKGSVHFLADLSRAVDLPLTLDFLGVSSYGAGTITSGEVRFTSDLSRAVEGRDLLVVEDVVDTGVTMKFLLDNLSTRKPASVRVCALLHKPSRARVRIPLDYVGFTIEDHFVVGYGLDHAERWRNLPYIAVLPPHA